MADEHTPYTPSGFTREELHELEKTGELTPFKPVSIRATLLVTLAIDPAIAQGLSVLSGKLDIFTDYTTFDKTRFLCVILYPVIFVIVRSLAGLLTSSARKRRREELAAIKAKKDQTNQIIENHQLAMTLVTKCEEHGIASDETEDDKSAIWVIAQSIGIANKDKAMSLYSEAKSPDPETEAILNEQAVQKSNDAKKRDSDYVAKLNELYPADQIGKDKYLTKVDKELQELEEKHKALLAVADYVGSGSVCARTKPKNTMLEAAKGQLIGGPGLAAARAASAETYNSNHPNGMPDASTMQAFTDWAADRRLEAIKLERKIKELRGRVDDVKARLIDMDNQKKYARFVRLSTKTPSLTAGGNIEVRVVPTAGETEDAMVIDEPAIVDGSVVIKAWLNEEQIGQAIYCPDGFDGNLSHAGFKVQRKDPVIILVDKPLASSDLSSITFTFEPETLWAIQKNPAA